MNCLLPFSWFVCDMELTVHTGCPSAPSLYSARNQMFAHFASVFIVGSNEAKQLKSVEGESHLQASLGGSGSG